MGTAGQLNQKRRGVAEIQSVAPSLAVEVSVIYGRDGSEIEQSIADFARLPNGGLVVAASPLAVFHRDLIVATAARRRHTSQRQIGTTTNPCAKVSDRIQIAMIDAAVCQYASRMLITTNATAYAGAPRQRAAAGTVPTAISGSRFIRGCARS